MVNSAGNVLFQRIFWLKHQKIENYILHGSDARNVFTFKDIVGVGDCFPDDYSLEVYSCTQVL
jgi:hypothetical protein